MYCITTTEMLSKHCEQLRAAQMTRETLPGVCQTPGAGRAPRPGSSWWSGSSWTWSRSHCEFLLEIWRAVTRKYLKTQSKIFKIYHLLDWSTTRNVEIIHHFGRNQLRNQILFSQTIIQVFTLSDSPDRKSVGWVILQDFKCDLNWFL